MTSTERAALQAAMMRLQRGDRGAFDVVYAGLWPLVRGACHRVLDHPADAEDAAQQALLQLFERAHQFDPARSVVGWAVALATWQARTQRQRRIRRRETAVDAVTERVDPALDPAALAERHALIAEVDAVIAGLSPLDRQTLDQIRADSAPPGATFRKRRQRALARLRAAWSNRHGS
jgi:RNA polymerase sigma-70 factor (ECF subfamily)